MANQHHQRNKYSRSTKCNVLWDPKTSDVYFEDTSNCTRDQYDSQIGIEPNSNTTHDKQGTYSKNTWSTARKNFETYAVPDYTVVRETPLIDPLPRVRLSAPIHNPCDSVQGKENLNINQNVFIFLRKSAHKIK